VTNANWGKGRAAQKLLTRQALMDTAVELVKAGRRPSVSAVADQAGVSRATAYRYFPSQDLMLSEATIRAAASAPDGPPPAGSTSASPEEVAAAITRQAGHFSLDHEERLRTALRLSLDPQSGYQRPGRRGRWVEEILAAAGDRLDEPARARLSAALHLVLGVDPIIALTDIAGLDRAEALDVLEWVAVTLVQASMTNGSSELPASLGEQQASLGEQQANPHEQEASSGGQQADAAAGPR
jgi:AcrR family transcriptional regulator